MKVSKETAMLLRLLNQYDNFYHIGQELAVSISTEQACNLSDLVLGYNHMKGIIT